MRPDDRQCRCEADFARGSGRLTAGVSCIDRFEGGFSQGEHPGLQRLAAHLGSQVGAGLPDEFERPAKFPLGPPLHADRLAADELLATPILKGLLITLRLRTVTGRIEIGDDDFPQFRLQRLGVGCCLRSHLLLLPLRGFLLPRLLLGLLLLGVRGGLVRNAIVRGDRRLAGLVSGGGGPGYDAGRCQESQSGGDGLLLPHGGPHDPFHRS